MVHDFLYFILARSILHPAASAGVCLLDPVAPGTSVALGRGQRYLLRVPRSLDWLISSDPSYASFYLSASPPWRLVQRASATPRPAGPVPVIYRSRTTRSPMTPVKRAGDWRSSWTSSRARFHKGKMLGTSIGGSARCRFRFSAPHRRRGGSLFLKALNEGRIIRPTSLKLMHHWRRLSFPLEYGYGTMRFNLSGPIRAITGIPLLWGYSGSTGSFLYYSQDLDLYLAGTIDQTESKIKLFILMGNAIRAVREERASSTIREQ